MTAMQRHWKPPAQPRIGERPPSPDCAAASRPTVLVTGGAGFIGSAWVHHLHERFPRYRILVLDSLTYAGNVHNLPNQGASDDRLEFWHGDIRNAELVDALVGRSDFVFHLAAESSVTRSIYDNRLFFETDVIGTQTVANAVAKHRERVQRFVHVSTSEVYGTALGETMNEEHPLNPMSPYAAAKCGADRLVWSYWQTYRIPAVIVRPFNNFGPRQHLEKVLPRFITNCLLGEPLRVHGDGLASRDFLHVEDHCDALERLLLVDWAEVEGEVINLGTGRHISIGQLAQLVRTLAGCEDVPIQCIGDRPGQVFRHTCDWSKARRLLGWQPAISLEEGIRRTIAWYREHEEWWRPLVWMREIPIISASGARELH